MEERGWCTEYGTISDRRILWRITVLYILKAENKRKMYEH